MNVLAAIDWQAVGAIVEAIVVVGSLLWSVFLAGKTFHRISDGVATVKDLVKRIDDHEKRIGRLESPRCVGA